MMEKRRSGFTFVELLVVIALALMLMVVILPIYSAAKARSAKTTCLSNLRQVGMAIQLYAQDNDEFLPLWMNRRHDEEGNASRWDSPELLCTAVYSKSKDPRVMFCPMDVYAGSDIEVFGVNHKFSSYFFNMKPPDSDDGTLTITGLVMYGIVVVPPADYLMARDSNLGKPEDVDGRRAYGCQHRGIINAIYVDLHVEAKKVKAGQILK